jgi:hypothetical protein
MLLDRLLPSNGVAPQIEAEVPVGEAIAPASAKFLAASPAIATPKPKAPATTASKRKSLTLLPAYVGLTKGEAIAKALEQHPGEVLHQDTII